MTAQQQLAELMRNTDNRAGAWQFEAQHWIRDHGPAIAELIEACNEFVEDQELLSHARIAAALRKLTQD